MNKQVYSKVEKTIHILLVDDHKMMRSGLRMLIEKQLDMEVFAEASTGLEALQMANQLRPDIILMDVSMPDLNGIDTTRKIKNIKQSSIKVIGLSMHSDRRYIIQMLNAGASGYLHKDDAFEELVDAIRTVIQGKIYLSPGIADLLKEK